MQRHEVIGEIMRKYARCTPISRKGIAMLYDRAASRGYDPVHIMIGLQTVIRKNYIRSEYTPPQNDPELEAVDERRYIEDAEFREIMDTYRCF